MRLAHKPRVAVIGTGALLVLLIATAYAVGGSGPKRSAGPTMAQVETNVGVGGLAPQPALVPARHAPVVKESAPQFAPGSAALPALGAPQGGASMSGGAASSGGAGSIAVGAATSGGPGSSGRAFRSVIGPSVDATRIVKTGELAIQVLRKDVQAKTDALVTLAVAQGGYVAESNTDLGGGVPSSEVVLRVPVTHFEAAIRAAQRLGSRTLSLTTSADDVTGQYVDLSARIHALERTRSTYLTILSRARTIGETLAVQQRVDDVQQQIDQLKGRIKLLRNQSSFSTLTVDLVPAGVVGPLHHANRHGIGAAWHRSWSRFDRGVNAIVAAIGPIVFAVLLLGLLALLGLLGYRGVRRAVARSHAAA